MRPGHAVAPSVGDAPAARSPWRAVAVPSEHGGWGLTFEPVLLGLLVAQSWAGLALGVAAVFAFLVRTPMKLVAIDRRRDPAGELLARLRMLTGDFVVPPDGCASDAALFTALEELEA